MIQVPAAVAIELGIRGTAFSARLVLQPGAAEAVLGRDADCQVRLPDPNRNVSRRHLAVRNLGGVLHLRVLSTVNGVWLATGEVPPGGAATVSPGQSLRLADYELTVRALQAPGAEDAWSELETQAASLDMRPAPAAQEDPFGDWFSRSTFGPGVPGSPALDAASLVPASDPAPLLRGLGLDPRAVGPLTEGELQDIGALARVLVGELLALHAESGAQAPGDNPLAGARSLEAVLRYLFGGRAAAAGGMPPQQAVREVAAALGQRLRHRQDPAGAADERE